MPIELIVCLVVLGLLTLGGIIWFFIDGKDQYKNCSVGMKVVYYIYHIILGAPYFLIRLVLLIVDKLRNRTHKAVKVL